MAIIDILSLTCKFGPKCIYSTSFHSGRGSNISVMFELVWILGDFLFQVSSNRSLGTTVPMSLQFSHGLCANTHRQWLQSASPAARSQDQPWNTCHAVTQRQTGRPLCPGAPLFAWPSLVAWHDERPKHTMGGEGQEGTSGLGEFLTTSGVSPFPTTALFGFGGKWPQGRRIMMIDV